MQPCGTGRASPQGPIQTGCSPHSHDRERQMLASVPVRRNKVLIFQPSPALLFPFPAPRSVWIYRTDKYPDIVPCCPGRSAFFSSEKCSRGFRAAALEGFVE